MSVYKATVPTPPPNDISHACCQVSSGASEPQPTVLSLTCYSSPPRQHGRWDIAYRKISRPGTHTRLSEPRSSVFHPTQSNRPMLFTIVDLQPLIDSDPMRLKNRATSTREQHHTPHPASLSNLVCSTMFYIMFRLSKKCTLSMSG